ncbi:uracil-DNA glycosylase [Spirulina sp. CS-785/01]|uniref:uracil-DNA glycosylase n=1 Tax=Spirulina sp. CS-785/01 TaxID=3021716 RepID=UPI003FA769DA
MLTRRGWIAVEDLHPQDLVATGTPVGETQVLQGVRNTPPISSPALVGQKTDWRPVTKEKTTQPASYSPVYCIDVAETANFVTPAGVVHNCRPPKNRTPSSEEIAACKPYLLEQIRLIDPKIILFTGATAYKGLTGKKQGITKIRGQWLEWEGRQCMAIFHPAYLLRNPSREKGKPKWLMWQDIQAVCQKLAELRGNS